MKKEKKYNKSIYNKVEEISDIQVIVNTTKCTRKEVRSIQEKNSTICVQKTLRKLFLLITNVLAKEKVEGNYQVTSAWR
jgi:hypothetical protein